MSEKPNYLEIACQKIDKLDKVWQQFPEFMRPDIKAFKESLVIDNFPSKVSHPPLYTGLKPEYRDVIDQLYDSFEVADASYTDHETGKTYLYSNLFSGSERLLEDFLSFQVGSFMYFTKKKINGAFFDDEEIEVSNGYKGEFCVEVPAREDTFIVRSGFGRRLFFNDGSEKGQLIADLPPKGNLIDPRQFEIIDEFFPQAFSLMTRGVLNRNGDVKELLKTIESGKIFGEDLLSDSPNFCLGIYMLAHFMDNNPWPIFDALSTGNTVETDRLMQEALTLDVGDESLLKFLINGWIVDLTMIQQFKKKVDIGQFLEEKIKQYWNFRKN